MNLHTYLNFDGDCRQAFEFYEQCLGGAIMAMMTFGDAPACGDMPADSRDRIMHACLQLDNCMIMGTDATTAHPYPGVSGAHVVVNVHEPAEAERVFGALSENGRVEMPMQETFWARRFGMAVDRFGVPWMVNCDLER